MGELILLSFLAAVALLIIMSKMGMGIFVKLSWLTDIIVSVILVIIFAGTFSGMVVGLMAGIFISIFLLVMRFIAKVRNLQ